MIFFLLKRCGYTVAPIRRGAGGEVYGGEVNKKVGVTKKNNYDLIRMLFKFSVTLQTISKNDTF